MRRRGFGVTMDAYGSTRIRSDSTDAGDTLVLGRRTGHPPPGSPSPAAAASQHASGIALRSAVFHRRSARPARRSPTSSIRPDEPLRGDSGRNASGDDAVPKTAPGHAGVTGTTAKQLGTVPSVPWLQPSQTVVASPRCSSSSVASDNESEERHPRSSPQASKQSEARPKTSLR